MVEEIRVVMFGKTGVGKSSLGNSILGREYFHAEASSQSVTKQPRKGERMIDNYKLVLVDTPGLFDTETNNIKTAKILVNIVKEVKPGPHIFIFVLTIGRFTEEEQKTVEYLKDLLGNHVTDYLIIVFTRKDDLKSKTFETYINKTGSFLKSIVSQCQGVMAINNNASGEEFTESVNRLLKMIKGVYLKNNKKYFTGELLDEAQKEFDEKMRLQEEIAHKKERELEAKLKQHEANMKQLEKQARRKTQEAEATMKLQKEEARRKEREQDDENKKLREENARVKYQHEAKSKEYEDKLEENRIVLLKHEEGNRNNNNLVTQMFSSMINQQSAQTEMLCKSIRRLENQQQRDREHYNSTMISMNTEKTKIECELKAQKTENSKNQRTMINEQEQANIKIDIMEQQLKKKKKCILQ